MASKSSKRATLYARVSPKNFAFIKKAAKKAKVSVAVWMDTKITSMRNKKATHA